MLKAFRSSRVPSAVLILFYLLPPPPRYTLSTLLPPSLLLSPLLPSARSLRYPSRRQDNHFRELSVLHAFVVIQHFSPAATFSSAPRQVRRRNSSSHWTFPETWRSNCLPLLTFLCAPLVTLPAKSIPPAVPRQTPSTPPLNTVAQTCCNSREHPPRRSDS
ncbi:hypothetical protein EDC01DRAFT_494868 [Geopyxis carbonaria]|nr:hypothetical protein EDC01DRAFT_494868 [Geopyxis carbonaria]